MSRGGRGGGRGGRGGGGVAADIVFDGKPSELFPKYDVPLAPSLSKKDERQVSFFLLFREQCHDGPLYTQARTWTQGLGKTQRTYGQDQINSRYGQTSKATVDPFLAVPTYSQKFIQPERTLPDLESRPFAKEFFPPELHATLDGDDGPSANKRRRTGPKSLALSHITALRTAEELFLPEAQQSYDKALQVLDTVEKNGDDLGFLSGEDDDDDWVKHRDEDDDGDGNVEEDNDEYDDESGDDYNAEQYFSGGDDDDDYGDDDDGGAGEF
ncbi:DNA-directed RNA polymerase III, subunit Rpc31 [Podospora appendiculata]|uniref:DNA-directed RNA polymerase III subunit n=1 Tax=Podospora appendiculata TaxID=314037 RepID=A0AAE0X9N7_9PEZI|nr:DNA-directed RNA polymerase III, subunit Rpc31 [Podospora appendiculata]